RGMTGCARSSVRRTRSTTTTARLPDRRSTIVFLGDGRSAMVAAPSTREKPHARPVDADSLLHHARTSPAPGTLDGRGSLDAAAPGASAGGCPHRRAAREALPRPDPGDHAEGERALRPGRAEEPRLPA